MSSNFPTSLDNSSTIPVESSTTPLATNHVIAHQNIQDAIEAIEAKIGVDSSAVTTSHDYKLGEVTGTDKAVGKTATQTITNKTITAPTITSPKITLGSDAAGDLHYTSNVDGTQSRLAIGTNNKILRVVSGVPAWDTENAAVDATTSVKGVVELATSSEVTAGTATGGTGAALVVTPDALAASVPTFDGSNLTGTRTKLNQVSAPIAQISNSSAENTLFTYSLAGGVLGTSGSVRISGLIETNQTSGGTITYTVRLKYGATTVVSGTFTTANGTTGTFNFNGLLMANASTSAQRGQFTIFGYDSTPTLKTTIAKGTATETSTGALNVVLTIQASSSTANTIDFSNLIIEKIV